MIVVTFAYQINPKSKEVQPNDIWYRWYIQLHYTIGTWCLMYWSNIPHKTRSCVLSDVKEETSCCCVKIFVKWCRKYFQSGGGAAVLPVVKSLLIIDIVRLTGFHFNYHTVPLAPSFKHFLASPRLGLAQHNVIICNAYYYSKSATFQQCCNAKFYYIEFQYLSAKHTCKS